MTIKPGERDRNDLLHRLARRPTRLGHRWRGNRLEALAVVMLGLALVAFPWGRLGPSRQAEAQPIARVSLHSDGAGLGDDLAGAGERLTVRSCDDAFGDVASGGWPSDGAPSCTVK
jgi:hypothetical protein